MTDNQSSGLPATCSTAFKEWAVVCEALSEGAQTIILRKGGIHEGREGFRVQHSSFWLYPTNFHQTVEQLSARAGDLLPKAQKRQPPAGEFHLRQLAVVDQVIHLTGEQQAAALQDLHILSPATVHERFHYRQPGLFLLIVRVYRQDAPHIVRETAEMAGCKSWVELPEAFSTAGLTAVLTDAEFAERKRAIAQAFAP